MTEPNRILAVEIRAARLGYAVFEKPRQLRDFGARVFGSRHEARRRIAQLLSLYSPSILVLHGAGARFPRNMRSRKGTARIARSEAKKLGIPFTSIPEQSFKSFFEKYSCQDKYDIAKVLAKWFPELAWRLPPALDFYDPEPRQIIYFDTIGLAVTYLEINRLHPETEGDGIFSSASK